MPASRGTTQMSGTLPWQRHGITTGGTSHYGGQNPPDVVPVRDLLGDDVLDVLLERSIDADGGLRLTGEGSMLGELVKAVLERALEAELSAHLGYAKDDLAGNNSGNSRNGVDRENGADRHRAGASFGAPRPRGHVRPGAGGRNGPGAFPAGWTT